MPWLLHERMCYFISLQTNMLALLLIEKIVEMLHFSHFADFRSGRHRTFERSLNVWGHRDRWTKHTTFHIYVIWLHFLFKKFSKIPLHVGFTEKNYKPWWRHQMETFSALLAICAGNSPVPVNSPRKGQWRGALMFSLICVWINGWVNNREAGDLRRHRAHYVVIVMAFVQECISSFSN